MSRALIIAAAALAGPVTESSPAAPARPAVLERLAGGQLAGVAGFLAAFGLTPDQERVFIDAAGWPLAIGAAMFGDGLAGGSISTAWISGLGPARHEALAAAGRVIAAPAQIRLVWQAGADGRSQLVRRYIGQAGRYGVVAELANASWTFTTPADRGGAPVGDGVLAWDAA